MRKEEEKFKDGNKEVKEVQVNIHYFLLNISIFLLHRREYERNRFYCKDAKMGSSFQVSPYI